MEKSTIISLGSKLRFLLECVTDEFCGMQFIYSMIQWCSLNKWNWRKRGRKRHKKLCLCVCVVKYSTLIAVCMFFSAYCARICWVKIRSIYASFERRTLNTFIASKQSSDCKLQRDWLWRPNSRATYMLRGKAIDILSTHLVVKCCTHISLKMAKTREKKNGDQILFLF